MLGNLSMVGPTIHTFTVQTTKVFTNATFPTFFRATEFADQVVGMPFVAFSDTTFQFSSVPLPPLSSGSKWFNELPEEFFKKKYRYSSM